MLLGVDVGGTFTDAALLDGDRLLSAKSPTTPADQSEGVVSAIRVRISLIDPTKGEDEDPQCWHSSFVLRLSSYVLGVQLLVPR